MSVNNALNADLLKRDLRVGSASISLGFDAQVLGINIRPNLPATRSGAYEAPLCKMEMPKGFLPGYMRKDIPGYAQRFPEAYIFSDGNSDAYNPISGQ